MRHDEHTVFLVFQRLNYALLGEGHKGFLTRVFKDATRNKPFSYLFIDIGQTTPEKFKFRTTVIPISGETVVYTPV